MERNSGQEFVWQSAIYELLLDALVRETRIGGLYEIILDRVQRRRDIEKAVEDLSVLIG